MIVDSQAAVQFLRTAFEPDDWIALFLKSYDTGRTAQRVGPVSLFLEPRIQAWLRAMNAQRFNIYVSVNAIRRGRRTRTKDAIDAVRHVFLEADEGGGRVIESLSIRRDIPSPSYTLESSPDRVHIFWRAHGFTTQAVERLQKHLASELRTDVAATACSQTTRVPGYRNHKRNPSHLVTATYHSIIRYGPTQFPVPPVRRETLAPRCRPSGLGHAAQRARRYLERVAAAIAGEHGDVHTFRVCCRVARGFALDDDEALDALKDWNGRCEPPWSEHELREKVRRARRYGHEAIGALL